MSNKRVFALTLFAMVAFAGNSLLCRFALKDTPIDAATFTSIRIVSGACMLWLIGRLRGAPSSMAGSWLSGLSLFAYAACFSFAYLQLAAGTGALLLFGAVQVTMIGYGVATGERLSPRQILGFMLACGGLVFFLLPGLSTPPLYSSGLMLGSGIAWGIYSLRGKNAMAEGRSKTIAPISMTAGNFLRAVPFTLVLSIAMGRWISVTPAGCLYAIASGALASGVGYSVWYIVLQSLKATSAATVQLSVPIIAAVGGIVFLGERLTPHLLIASIAILGGIALVISEKLKPNV